MSTTWCKVIRVDFLSTWLEFATFLFTTTLRSRTGSQLRTAENDAWGNGHSTQGGMLSLSGPLTQHPERTLLPTHPTHRHYPPTNLGRLPETFHTLFTLTLTHGFGVRLLTPLVWGSPLTAAHPDWSHISPSPGDSDGASEGGFYYTGHLWQPWFPLGKPRLPPATRPPASPWAAAGGSVCEERFRGRLHTDGVRSRAEPRATALGHTESRAPPTGGSDEWGAEADWPSTTKHNTARKHMTIKDSQKHFFSFFISLLSKRRFTSTEKNYELTEINWNNSVEAIQFKWLLYTKLH